MKNLVNMVGKQSPWYMYLSIMHTSHLGLIVQTAPKFGKHRGHFGKLCPPLKGRRHTDFGADPVGISVSVTVSCVHDIS